MSGLPPLDRFPRSAAKGGGAEQSSGPAAGRHDSGATRVVRPGLALGDGRHAIAPDPQIPHWRGRDGARESYQTLRCGLEPWAARELGQAHIGAIEAIAAAALAAAERGERREARRLAAAAGRLCGEIAGRWPPTAVEIPSHRAEAEP